MLIKPDLKDEEIIARSAKVARSVNIKYVKKDVSSAVEANCALIKRKNQIV
jgi:hypothetical protein